MNSPEMKRAYEEWMAGHPHRDLLDEKEILKYINDQSRVVITGLGGPPGPHRSGVWLFFTMSEHTFYDPTIPAKSNQWEMIAHLWNDLVWITGVFPAQHESKLERIARRCGLVFSRGIPQVWEFLPGVPAQGAARRLLHPKAETLFPLDATNVRTLEYLPGQGAKFTDREENDQLRMWHERGKDRARTNWWPDTIG